MRVSRRGALAASLGLSLSGCTLNPGARDSDEREEVAPIATDPSAWPAPGFDGGNRKANTAVPIPADRPELSFETTVAAGGNPVLADGTLVLNGKASLRNGGQSSKLTGFDLDSRSVAWRWVSPPGKKERTNSIICGERVFVIVGNRVAALELHTGEVLWETDIESMSIRPDYPQTLTSVSGQLIVACTEGLVSLDGDGEVIWYTDTDSEPMLQSEPPVAHDGQDVYVASEIGKTYALRTDVEVENGLFGEDRGVAFEETKAWDVEFEVTSEGPTFHEGHVYQPYHNGVPNIGVAALDGRSGDAEWMFTVDEVGVAISVVDETVFVASPAGKLHAVDAETGAARWTESFAEEGEDTTYVSLVGGADGVLLTNALDDGDVEIQCFGMGGELRWEMPVPEIPTILHTEDRLILTAESEEATVSIRSYR